MGKLRVHEIAKKHGATSKEILEILNAAGIEAKAAASSVEEDAAEKAIKAAKNGGKSAKPAAKKPPAKSAAAKPAGTKAEVKKPTAPKVAAKPTASKPAGAKPAAKPASKPAAPATATAKANAQQAPAAKQATPQKSAAAKPTSTLATAPAATAPAKASGSAQANQPTSAAKPASKGAASPAQPGTSSNRPQAGSRPGSAGRPGTSGGAGRPASSGGANRPASSGGTGRPASSGGAGAVGKRRRVVIDSQASRRGSGPPVQQGPPSRRGKGRRRRPVFEEPDTTEVVEPTEEVEVVTRLNSGATVKEVSETLGLTPADVIKKLMELGELATLTQTLSDDAIVVLAEAFQKKVDIVTTGDEADQLMAVTAEDQEELVERPPVVTIMGHVDHGKTSLLDSIRETEVAAGEAGGITQHIGAYQVHHGEKLVTFIDTPGHEAFTAMRARGASVTDIAVIVVAADDGIKPQTQEAIDHAKAAGVPIVIAVNKIDKEGADPQKVRSEFGTIGLTPEDWGGDTIFCDVSAKQKLGLEHLLDMLSLVAEVEELKGNPKADASGTVIESKLDPGRGPVVSVLIQRGELGIGDALVAGAEWGRVRAMNDYTGTRIKHASLGMPVEVLGFDGVPEAGQVFRVVKNERVARQQAGDRANRLKTEAIARRQGVKVSLEDVFAQAKEGAVKSLNLIVKADVAGSLGALEDEIAKLPQSEIAVKVIHDGVGGITESDVMLASASEAVVVGFNVRPVGEARQVAAREGVEIRTYNVIYRVVEELRSAMQGMLEPEEVEETVGSVEIRQTFKASKIGTIAGSHVTEGKIARGASVRLVRDGTVVYEGKIGSLRRFNDDVREVTQGLECGVVLENYADVKEGDVIEVFEVRSVERELA